jgi:NADH dehydrogenase (ubiquinone) flavoprotein 2
MSTVFKFSPNNQKKIKQILMKYPQGRAQSAVMPLLDLAQHQNGWISQQVMEAVAKLLQMPIIRVHEVATFYSMYRLQPVGKTVIQVCTTTPCWLRGSDDLLKVCKRKLDLAPGETKQDISLFEVQCLGGCVNAPLVQINDMYVEDLNAQRFERVLDNIQTGKSIQHGSTLGRISSEPLKGAV